MAELNLIPKKAAQKIRRKAKFSLSQIAQFERVTKHDVTAFLKSVGQSVGPEARFIHKGLTSSDVLDTALSLQMRQSLDLIGFTVEELIAALKRRALYYRDTPMMGRSHGVHAEPEALPVRDVAGEDEREDAVPLQEHLLQRAKLLDAFVLG